MACWLAPARSASSLWVNPALSLARRMRPAATVGAVSFPHGSQPTTSDRLFTTYRLLWTNSIAFLLVTTPSRFRLWQPPGRFEDRPTERRISFLELFFDLVFVVVVPSFLTGWPSTPRGRESVGSSFSSMRCGRRRANGTLYHVLARERTIASVRVFTSSPRRWPAAMMGVSVGSVPGARRGGICPCMRLERPGPRPDLVSHGDLRPRTSACASIPYSGF